MRLCLVRNKHLDKEYDKYSDDLGHKYINELPTPCKRVIITDLDLSVLYHQFIQLRTQ